MYITTSTYILGAVPHVGARKGGVYATLPYKDSRVVLIFQKMLYNPTKFTVPIEIFLIKSKRGLRAKSNSKVIQVLKDMTSGVDFGITSTLPLFRQWLQSQASDFF